MTVHEAMEYLLALRNQLETQLNDFNDAFRYFVTTIEKNTSHYQ